MNQGRGNLYGSDAPRMRAARGVSQALRDLGIRELSVKAQVGSRRSLAAAGYSISSDDMHEQQTARSGARNGIRTRTAFRPGRFKLDHPVSADVHGCPLAQVSPINVRRRASDYMGEQRLKLRLLALILLGWFEVWLGPQSHDGTVGGQLSHSRRTCSMGDAVSSRPSLGALVRASHVPVFEDNRSNHGLRSRASCASSSQCGARRQIHWASSSR